MRFIIGIPLFSFFILSSIAPAGNPQTGASGCGGCARRAIVGSADAGATGVVLRESLISRLAETLTSPCFHLQRTDIAVPGPEAARFGSKAEPPEYVFEAKYEENLNQRGADGSAVMNRLTIDLFYEGSPREKVASWSVTSGINSYTACANRMFTNSDAVMKGVRPIEALLEDFERRPTHARLDLLHKATELGAGQEWELELLDLRDAQGRKPRPFNRVVVKAEQGDILNGAACEDDPRAKAFVVGEGGPEIRYKAPDKKAVTRDTVTVYSSCEIRPENAWPLSRTRKGDKIAETTVAVTRGDYTLDLRFEKTWAYDSTNAPTRHEGEFVAVVSGPLRKLAGSRPPMVMFEPAGVSLTWTYRDKATDLKPEPGCATLLSEHTGSGIYPVRNSNPMALILHSFAGLGGVGERAAAFGMTDYYELVLEPMDVPALKALGLSRSSPPRCQEYREHSVTVGRFSLTLRAKMSKEEVLSGSARWTSDNDSGYIELVDLPEMLGGSSRRPSKPGSRFAYSLTWKITKTPGS
jgi:hypothetical protein